MLALDRQFFPSLLHRQVREKFLPSKRVQWLNTAKSKSDDKEGERERGSFLQTLVEQNHLTNRIQVIAGRIEEVSLPEHVDIIISEPMGDMFYNERMLESYLHAKQWFKPQGKIFPTTGDLYVTPFTDEALYMEQVGKPNFWYQQSFYGVDLTTLRDAALEEYFKQPIVDHFDVRLCLAKPMKYSVNFLTAHEED
jgi:type I protein arginine methyltransferase